MSLKSIILTSMAVAALSASAYASDFELVQTVTVPAYDFKVDIVGIEPGMKADAALEALKERKPGMDVGATSLRIGNGTVSSSSFDTMYYIWEREKEEFNVYLTSPSTGNEVFAASRALDFWNKDEQPDFEKTIAALVEKYGEPSAREDILPDPKYINHTSKTVTLMWYLGGEGKCDLKQHDSMGSKPSDVCTKVRHETGPSARNNGYEPRRAKEYLLTATAGSDVVLVAAMYNHDGSERISRMSTSFTDLKRRALTVQADEAAIQAAQEQFDSIKVDAPDL